MWPPWPWRGEGHPCALPANRVPQAHLPRGSDLQLRLQGGRRQAVSTSAHLETCHSHRGDQVHPVPSAPNPAPCTGPRLMQACPGARSLAPAPVSPPSPTLSLPRPCPLPASSLPSPCLVPACHPRWVRPLLHLPGHLLAILGSSSVEGTFLSPDLLSGSPRLDHAGGSRSDTPLCPRPSHNRREVRTIRDFWTLLGAMPSMQESQEWVSVLSHP